MKLMSHLGTATRSRPVSQSSTRLKAASECSGRISDLRLVLLERTYKESIGAMSMGQVRIAAEELKNGVVKDGLNRPCLRRNSATTSSFSSFSTEHVE
jgi:hypothetical protein